MEKHLALNLMIVLIAGIYTLANALGLEGFTPGLKQSPHNFSQSSWLPLARMCHVCHTVHNAALPAQRYPDGLLWKRDINSVSYILYHSYWGAAFYDTREQTRWTSSTGKKSNLPDGLSKLCLTCHDGIIATDVFILHHYVSAEYDVTKTKLRDPYQTLMGMSGTISEVLDRGKIQCTSCHDVHGVESAGNTRLLRAEKPDICITCHDIIMK